MVCEELEFEYGSERMTEEQAQIVAKSKEEMLESTTSQTTLFADEEPERFKIAKRLAGRYHFFHPMLEFIEVFWLRDGFDIICGNPPWLKLQFDDKAVLSERYPEVLIHKVSAPDARTMQTRFMEDESMRRIYEDEQMEVQCSSAFMNAFANYPLLIGQQTNLYKCVLTNTFDLASAENGYIGILCPESIYDDPKGQPLRRELYKRLRYHFQYQNELRQKAEVHHRASLRSAIFSIPTQWTLALHTMGTEIVAELKIKRAIGIQLPTRIVLFTLVKKSYAYLPKHLRTRMIGKQPS